MNKRILAALLGFLTCITLSTAQADDAWIPDSTHLSLEGGLSTGGDMLVTLTDSSGKTKSIHAGDSIFTDVGVQHNFADSAWSLRATAGFADASQAYNNATVHFDYLPLNVLGIYSMGNNHFGAGLTVHAGPELDLDGLGPNTNFKTAVGLVLQYQYWLFGVRYTAIRYKVSNLTDGSNCVADCSVSGNSIGLFFNYVF